MASEKEEEPKVIIEIISKISRDKKETTIRIPSELVSKFNIDAEKDSFKWIVFGDDKQISLHGTLIKGEQDEKKDRW